MLTFSSYQNAIITLLPLFSSVTCGILMLLSLRHSLTGDEHKLKSITGLYLGMATLAWLTTFTYYYEPEVFVFLNALCLLTYLLNPILFYHIVYRLTALHEKKKFSGWHYLAPVALAALLLAWSLFVPYEVQLEIVEGKGQVIPEGKYEMYAHLFLSKPLLRMLFNATYSLLTVWLLATYYRKAARPTSLVRKPSRWIVFITAISLVSMFVSILIWTTPRDRILFSVWTQLVIFFVVLQHILLTYHVIRRKYLLFVIVPEFRHSVQNETEQQFQSEKISQSALETYFSEQKPYLRTDFRITELAEAFNISRARASAFINKTYGINFNRYINQWRLKEMQRLSRLPENQGQQTGNYLHKAGFTDRRQYNRVLKAERDAAEAEGTNAENNRQ